ncbi:MAG TPA: HEAT repeat domain-containing protein [Pirellulales bacterium]|nr:HEAT repeat domain-containing protein [Pirellulales bacterium]
MKTTLLIAWLLLTSVIVGPARPSDDASEEADVDDLDRLIQRLSSDDAELQHAALFKLKYDRTTALSALPVLVEVVKKSNHENRISALRIIAELGPPGKAASSTISEALSDENSAVRIAAAFTLLRIGSTSDAAIDVLSGALHDAEEEHRLAAARNLADCGRAAKGAAKALAAAATDKSADVRAEVAEALGAIGPISQDSSLAALRALLADESSLVQVNAARSLWQLDEPAEALVPKLVQVLDDFEPISSQSPRDELFLGDRVPARIAIELLGEIGPEAKAAVGALIAAVDSASLALQFRAVDALGAIGPEAEPAIERLERALRDAEVYSAPFVHHVRCLSDQAAVALRRIGPASTEVLVTALDDHDQRVRFNATEALGYLPQSKERALPGLVKLLDDRHESVRVGAAFALERLGPAASAAAPALAPRLNDRGKWTSFPGGGIGSTYTVGDHVLAALANLKPEPESIVPAIVRELNESRRVGAAMCEMLRRLGPAAKATVGALEPLLNDPDDGLSAALAMARIDPDHEGLLEKLRSGLLDPNPISALQAARGLGDLGGLAAGVIPDLYLQLDRQQEPIAKAIVAAAIVKIDRRQEKAVIELATGLQESGESFKFAGHDEASSTWSNLGEQARPALGVLIEGLTYESADRRRDHFWAVRHDAQVRLRSAELLIDVSTHMPEAIEALVELCRTADCGHRGMAADALGRIGPAAANASAVLARLLADEEFYIVGGDFYGNGGTSFEPGERAALALGRIGVAAVPALRAALKDDEPLARQHAAQALESMGPPARDALDDLMTALIDPNRRVRASAAKALGKMGDTGQTTVAALARALADRQLVVRTTAAAALGDLGPAARQAAPEISKLRDDPFESARTAARAALRGIGAE